ncbi:hypothetical protein M513_11832 [Trichuris suis]|uniref:Uncharacterized protein n=1 Tax=Trichuris suis TaxID=68888 RepID=A0A085LQN3_9BILA|nr:hypothetical protein M513_11832 [Trichuris suis]
MKTEEMSSGPKDTSSFKCYNSSMHSNLAALLNRLTALMQSLEPGVEPGSIAWKATMLTATPSTPWQSSATAYVGCLNQSLTQLRRCSYFSYILQFDTVDGAVVSVITSYGTDSCNYGFLACRLDSKCYCVDRESNPDRLLGRQPC